MLRIQQRAEGWHRTDEPGPRQAQGTKQWTTQNMSQTKITKPMVIMLLVIWTGGCRRPDAGAHAPRALTATAAETRAANRL